MAKKKILIPNTYYPKCWYLSYIEGVCDGENMGYGSGEFIRMENGIPCRYIFFIKDTRPNRFLFSMSTGFIL